MTLLTIVIPAISDIIFMITQHSRHVFENGNSRFRLILYFSIFNKCTTIIKSKCLKFTFPEKWARNKHFFLIYGTGNCYDFTRKSPFNVILNYLFYFIILGILGIFINMKALLNKVKFLLSI